ncbi:MAG: S1/P1 Nuclease, partial [Chitinophagaceae bacterium]
MLIAFSLNSYCWGFFGHRKINEYAVYLLPQEMLVFYKKHISYLSAHAPDPDKRRYALADEGSRHYIDIDLYGIQPFDSLPRKWEDAVAKYTLDTIIARGIVPWHILVMQQRLTKAFRDHDLSRILKNSAEIGHYISDAHVPLHTSHNHNGQHTGQHGIHGFWESRIPELLADEEFDFFMEKAQYISNTSDFIWSRVLESAAASDSVLKFEKKLSQKRGSDELYAFEERNGIVIKQYSSSYTRAYNNMLNGMVERRMRQSVHSVASFWYTAWVDAGQPNLDLLLNAGKEGPYQEN